MTGPTDIREDMGDHATTGIELLAAFADRYDEQGFPLPPVPETMVDDLRLLGEAAATTRGDAIPGPYGIRWFVDEAIANRAPDYCLFGEDGHGINSYGFHWYLVAGHVAIFVQVGYGGIYQANNTAGAELTRLFDAARPLINSVVEACDAGRIPSDQSIIVIESFTMGSAWARHTSGKEPAWHSSPDPFESARRSL